MDINNLSKKDVDFIALTHLSSTLQCILEAYYIPCNLAYENYTIELLKIAQSTWYDSKLRNEILGKH